MLVGGVVGAAIALIAFPWDFFTGASPFWTRPLNDINAYLVAWHYFLHDAWRFPLFGLPAMGYPEGGSVLFNDGLPVAVLISKLIHALFGAEVNPFGYWIFLTYILLGAFAARFVAACGVRAWWVWAVAAFLAIGRMFFMWRLGHTAISSHFLLLWALALYVEDASRARFSLAQHALLSVTAILVNAYLVVMVALVQAVTVLTLAIRRALGLVDIVRILAVPALVLAVGLIEGYGAMLGGSGSMRADGFGTFSWNLATLAVPPPALWGDLGIVRDATGGQYEGDAYSGLGVLAVVAASLFAYPKRSIAVARRHWVFVIALIGCALFAASNRVYLASHLLLNIDLPTAAVGAASFFRASGRFIWIPAYAVSLAAIVGMVRWAPLRVSAGLLVVAVLLQASEVGLLSRRLRAGARMAQPELLDTAQLRSWVERHERVFQFPSWSCGGLTPSTTWGSVEANRELAVELTIARVGRPTNSVYTSRQLKDCAAEASWINRTAIEPGVLYILSRSLAMDTPQLLTLAHSSQCIDVHWGIVCSASPLDIVADSAPAEPSMTAPAEVADPARR